MSLCKSRDCSSTAISSRVALLAASIFAWGLSSVARSSEPDIQLNGTAYTFEVMELSEAGSGNRLINDEFGFSIDLPPEESGLIFEEQTLQEYNRTFIVDGPFSDMSDVSLKLNPHIAKAKVFRLYHPKPIPIQTDKKTKNGPRASRERMKQARVNSDFELPEELQGLFSEFEVNYYDELVITVFDRTLYELSVISSQQGRDPKPHLLAFLLGSGNTLPAVLDPYAVQKVSISNDNQVFGLYMRPVLVDPIVDGIRTDELGRSVYRIYAMNSKFIYQVTLTYTDDTLDRPSNITPLKNALSSFRFVQGGSKSDPSTLE